MIDLKLSATIDFHSLTIIHQPSTSLLPPSTFIAAIFYFVPNLFPFLSPYKWSVAGNANFLWKIFFLYLFAHFLKNYLSRLARNFSAFSLCIFLFSGAILSKVFTNIPSRGFFLKKLLCTSINRQNNPSHISHHGPFL